MGGANRLLVQRTMLLVSATLLTLSSASASAQALELAATIVTARPEFVRARPPTAKTRPKGLGLAERHALYERFIEEAALLFQLPPAFLYAVARVESNFDPYVVSRKGARGLMQLMPATVTEMGIVDAFDPRLNILAGARLLRLLANQWNGDLVLTVASYNAGLGAVRRYHGVPPYAETRGYVVRVMRHYAAYREGRVLSRR